MIGAGPWLAERGHRQSPGILENSGSVSLQNLPVSGPCAPRGGWCVQAIGISAANAR
jgi:hypothetical protein